MFPTFTDIKISSSSCRWWQTFLVKTFQSIMRRRRDFTNLTNQVSAALFFKPQWFFLKPKLIEKFALSSENNLRESGKVLTNLMRFLKSFLDCHFLGEICIHRDFFQSKNVYLLSNHFQKGLFCLFILIFP